jgi:DNA recombination protein RmuC
MLSALPLLLALLVGVALGAVIGWFIRHARAAAPVDSQLEAELRRQLQDTQLELQKLRTDIGRLTTSEAEARARAQAAAALLDEQKRAHEKAHLELRDAFRVLSAEALEKAQPQLLTLADEAFKKFHAVAQGDLSGRQQAIATLVKPLEENLRAYQQSLQQSEASQVERVARLKEELQNLGQQSQMLSQQTLQLRLVLSNSQARGRWGEETLRRVVEAAGMSAHCDFTEQAHSGEGKPDLIVHLPGDRMIVLDAKVPELEFLHALESNDPARRAEALQQHATKLRATIKALADRDYPKQFPTALDYVILFMPAESLFSAALEVDPDLILWAGSRNIMLATPASLIALLRAISFSWQQHSQTENARAIIEAAQELFGRICTFTEHLERLRGGLDRATRAFNDAVGSYERSIRPSGDRLVKLGAGLATKQLLDLDPLDTVLRLPAPSEENDAELTRKSTEFGHGA